MIIRQHTRNMTSILCIFVKFLPCIIGLHKRKSSPNFISPCFWWCNEADTEWAGDMTPSLPPTLIRPLPQLSMRKFARDISYAPITDYVCSMCMCSREISCALITNYVCSMCMCARDISCAPIAGYAAQTVLSKGGVTGGKLSHVMSLCLVMI